MRTQKIITGLLVVVSVGLTSRSLTSGSEEKIPAIAPEKKAAASASQPALVIQLQADKKAYRQKDEIHFHITYLNQGQKPLRFLVDDAFAGSDFQCKTQAGDAIAFNGGYSTWSPKVGVFTGRPHLLQPGEKKVFAVDALVDHRYDLVFSNEFKRHGTDGFKPLRARMKLPADYPDKYISAGRIFPAGKPGKYMFQCRYQGTEHDKYWRFTGAKTPEEVSVEHLWIGEAVSNVVEIEIR